MRISSIKFPTWFGSLANLRKQSSVCPEDRIEGGSGEIDILLTAEAIAVSTPVQAKRIAADGACVATSITCFSNEVKNVWLCSDIGCRGASATGSLSTDSARRLKSISKSRNFSLVIDAKRSPRRLRKSIARIKTVTGQARCEIISDMNPRYSGALVIS